VPAALRVRFLRAACPACWLLDMSRLIASWMVFRAQGASPASCARELGLNPAAPMLQHILNKKNSCNHGSRPRLSAPGLASASEYHLQAASDTGGCFLAVFSPLLQLSSGYYCNVQPSLVITRGALASPGCSNQGHVSNHTGEIASSLTHPPHVTLTSSEPSLALRLALTTSPPNHTWAPSRG